MRGYVVVGLIVSALLFASAVHAEVPNRLTYQGRLARRGVSVSGNHIFVVRIIGQDGTALWSSGNITQKLPITGEVLGTWNIRSIQTSYQENTDGFVQVVASCASDTYNHTVTGVTDSSPTPSTIRAWVMPWDQAGSRSSQHQTFTMPVRKGDFWRVNVSDADTSATVYFIPFGL